MLSACLSWKNIKLMLLLVLSDDFDVLMSKIKKIWKQFILMHFEVKNTFEKLFAPQYQTHT